MNVQSDGSEVIPIRVLIVDQSAESSTWLSRHLSSSQAISVVAQVNSPHDLLAVVARSQPDVIVMDPAMTDFDAEKEVRLVRERYPRITVLIVTSGIAARSQSVTQEFRSLIAAGATGYLLKEKGTGGWIDAVHQAAAGWSVVDPDLLRMIANRPPNRGSFDRGLSQRVVLDQLTPRELDVLALLGRGMTNAQLCRYFGSALPTIKKHVSSVLAKLGVENRAQAALIARDFDLQPIQPPVI